MPRRANNNQPAKLISKKPKTVELTPKQKRQLWWITYKNVIVVIAVVLSILGTTIFAIVIGENKNVESTDGQYTLMDLGSSGCIPCDNLQPILASLRTKYKGKINVNFYDIQKTPKGKQLATQYGIITMPTLIYLDKNGKEVYRSEGYKSQADIEADFRRLGWIQ